MVGETPVDAIGLVKLARDLTPNGGLEREIPGYFREI